MQAVVVEKPGQVVLKEVAVPVPPRGFARVYVKAAAICATDLEVIAGRIPARYPLIPGHEWSGLVDAVGDEADRSWLGKRVVGSNDVVCLRCEACRSGKWRYCPDFEEIGFKRNGAYAEYVVVPTYGLCELPEHVPFVQGALGEPLGVALGTLEKAGARFGQTLMIMGAGSIGLCLLAVGKAMGLRRIVVCSLTNGRLGIARQMGAMATIATREQDLKREMARLHPGGTDVIVDATGIEDCIRDCLQLTRPGGVLALAGYGRGKEMSFRMDDIHINNLRVIGAGNNWNQLQLAVTLMAERMVDLQPLVTREMPLADYAVGLKLAAERPEGFVKAVFVR